MHILIIGGTIFVGRALVEAAQSRGHTLTLFNRGQTNPGAYPDIETITGDRGGDLSALSERRWDAVIDTCGYFPRLVRHSAQTLAQAAGHYTFISSISVYADISQPGLDETAKVGKLENESVEEITGETYGPLKALCEQAVEAEMPGRNLVIRPGLIVGPHDSSDRFTYWVMRVKRGGKVLAPGRPGRGLQFIDVRDLAEWTLRLIEEGQIGVFNATGLPEAITMTRLLERCREISGSAAHFTWVEDAFLVENKVGEWREMPLWVPESDPQSRGLFTISMEKALEAGLRFRPIEETVRATLQWASTRPADYKWRAGLTAEREAELLALWEKRK